MRVSACDVRVGVKVKGLTMVPAPASGVMQCINMRTYRYVYTCVDKSDISKYKYIYIYMYTKTLGLSTAGCTNERKCRLE